MSVTTGWQAEQLDGVGSTFAQVFVQVIADKEASSSPRRSSLTWRKTIKDRAEKFHRDAPTVNTDVTEASESTSVEPPRRKQREYRPATGSVQWCILLALQLCYNGLTGENQEGLTRKQLAACCSSIQHVARSFSSDDHDPSAPPTSITVSTTTLKSLEKRELITIYDPSGDKEYRLTDVGLSLGQRILASVEFPLAALSSIRCTTTGSESSDTRKRRRLSYTGAPVPEKDLDEFRYAGTQPLPNPTPELLPAMVPSGPWEPVLVVDVRESSLIKELTSLGVRIESRSLPITDFLWLMKRQSDGRELIMGVGGERKTWQDLSASIIDGRYDEQKYRLASKATSLDRIFYVIEGDVERSHGGMRTLPSATLRSALCNTRITGGFGAITTSSVRHSARLLAKMHRSVCQQGAFEDDSSTTTYEAFGSSCAKTVGITVRDLTGAMIRQVPGCGAEATKALLEITEKRMGNVTVKNISELLKTTSDSCIMQAAKAESSTNRSPITQKLLWRLKDVFTMP